jgi:hypothetical protein
MQNSITNPISVPTKISSGVILSGNVLARVNGTTASAAAFGNVVVVSNRSVYIAGSNTNSVPAVAISSLTDIDQVIAGATVLNGEETITDCFVNISGSSGLRLFLLTDRGNLYATGDNSSGVVCSGMVAPTAQATAGWERIKP